MANQDNNVQNIANQEKKSGTVIGGRYRIRQKIGTGASASVYLADDNMMQRWVALKILAPDTSDLLLNTRAFQTEVKAASALSHDNIVRIHDVSLSGKEKYIVMEYVEGVTLRDYLDEHKVLSLTETISCVEQILRALREAHKNDIVHRDIKPQNIIVSKDGIVKVTDFGIAKLPDTDRFRLTDRAVGTVHYISPEQAGGGTTDARSDLYSLGVMMYELTTGRLPFDAETPSAIAMKQVTEMPQSPRKYNPKLPQGMEQIILRAMEKDPADRYKNADEMLAAVKKIKQDAGHVFQDGVDVMEPQRPSNISAVGKMTTAITSQIQSVTSKIGGNRTKRMLLIAAIAAVLLIAALTVTLIVVLNQRDPYVQMTDLVNQQYETVVLPDGVSIGKVTFVYSNLPKGTILEQSVQPNNMLALNSTVDIVVSLGRQQSFPVEISDDSYYASTKEQLEQAFRDYNITIVEEYVNSASVKKGYIIKADAEAVVGGEYHVQISAGPRVEFVLPDFVGEQAKLSAVIEALNAAGMLYELNGTATIDTAQVVKICRKSDGTQIEAGTVLSAGTTEDAIVVYYAAP